MRRRPSARPASTTRVVPGSSTLVFTDVQALTGFVDDDALALEPAPGAAFGDVEQHGGTVGRPVSAALTPGLLPAKGWLAVATKNAATAVGGGAAVATTGVRRQLSR